MPHSNEVEDLQTYLKRIMVKGGDFTQDRFDTAWSKLSSTDAPMLAKMLVQAPPDGQITINKPGTGSPADPKGIAVVDCRTTSPTGGWQDPKNEIPFKIKGAFDGGGDIGQGNKIHFNRTLTNLMQAKVTDLPAKYVVFYDNKGQHRGPEMCLRYIDFLLNHPDPLKKAKLAALWGKQFVSYLDGGINAFMKKVPGSPLVEPFPPQK